MLPKEKAEELVGKYSIGYPIICKNNSKNMYKSEAIQCALIAVDEILEIVGSDESAIIVELQFWQQVKQEIEQL